MTMIVNGQKIQKSRENASLTQRELAERAGLGENSVYQIENGIHNPRFESVKKIAALLDVSLDYLADRTDDPKSHKGNTNLAPDEQEFLSAWRRGDLETVSIMLGKRFRESTPKESNITRRKPAANE